MSRNQQHRNINRKTRRRSLVGGEILEGESPIHQGGFNNLTNSNFLDRFNLLDVQDGADYGTCNLVSLFPFTFDNGYSRAASQAAMAVWLAIHHLNTGDGSIVPQVQGLNERCSVVFAAEFLNTRFRSGPALKAVMERINEFNNPPTDDLEDNNTTSLVVKPRPCAFIGAFRSPVSEVTSAVTGLEGYTQVSGGSTSTTLDDKDQFPKFARTVPSDAGTAQAMLNYVVDELQIKNLVVLNDDDPYANSYASNLRNYVSRNPEIDLNLLQVTVDKYNTDVVSAVRTIKESQLRYIFVIKVFGDELDKLLEEAVQQGIAGNAGYTWLFADGVSSATITSKNLTKNSPLHRAYRGSGMVVASSSTPHLEDDSFPHFLEQLRALQNNTEEMDELKAVLPHLVDEYNHRPVEIVGETNATALLHSESFFTPDRISKSGPFFYEAAILLGLSACGATTDNFHLNKQSLYDELVQTSFDGISGRVRLDPTTGTRLGNSSYFSVLNFVDRDSDPESEHLRLTAVNTHLAINGTWGQLRLFQYNDGGTERPLDLPEQSIIYNDIETPIRVMVLIFCAISILLALGCAAWTYFQRSKPIVMASQPAFLYLICTGTAIFACTIIPLTFDLNQVSSESMSGMCTSALWLLCVGAALTLSALFSKTRRINKIMAKAKKFRRIKVTVKETVIPIIVFLLLNIAILSAMTIWSPVPYDHVTVSYDAFGRESEYYGRCQLSDSIAYTIPLAILNLGMLCLAIFQAWRARELSTEYQESEHIFRALWVIFLVIFIGLPVLVIARDNPDASVFLSSAIIAVSSCAIVSLIFVPKMKYLRESERSDEESKVKISGLKQSALSNWSSGNVLTSSKTNSPSTDSQEDYGDRIISTKTKRELVEENTILKRRIHALEKATREGISQPTSASEDIVDQEEPLKCKEENQDSDVEKNE